MISFEFCVLVVSFQIFNVAYACHLLMKNNIEYIHRLPNKTIQVIKQLSENSSMSTGARLFFVGSVIVTGATVFGVNYYIDEEKQRKRANILIDIQRREEQHRLNMQRYEQQTKLEEKLRERDR